MSQSRSPEQVRFRNFQRNKPSGQFYKAKNFPFQAKNQGNFDQNLYRTNENSEANSVVAIEEEPSDVTSSYSKESRQVKKQPEIVISVDFEAEQSAKSKFSESQISESEMNSELIFEPKLDKKNPFTLFGVKNFTVSNDFGSVKYLEPLDLTQIPKHKIEKIINIQHANIEFKPLNTGNPRLDQLVVDNLNKNCLLNFYDLYDSDKISTAKFKKKAQKFAEKIGATFVSFDHVANETIYYCHKPL